MAESHAVFYSAAPTSSAGSAKQKGRSQAVTVASATDVAIGNVETPDEYMICICTTAAHIRFGGAQAGGAPGAAVAGDYLLAANQTYRFKIPINITLFSIIRDAADGIFYWYLPG